MGGSAARGPAVSLTLPPDRPGSTSDDFCARGIFGCPAIAVAEARENSEAGEEGGGKCHRKERRGPASSPESWKSADGAQQGGHRAPGLAHSSSAAPLPPRPTWRPAHLAHCGLLLAQAHDEDAVCLPDAALGPGREGAVRLVEHDAVDVLLLPQPAAQPVLVGAGGHRRGRTNTGRSQGAGAMAGHRRGG